MALCRGLGRFHLFLASPPGLGEDCAKTAAETESLDADTLNSRKIFWTIVLPGGSRASASIQSIAEHPEHRRTSRASPNIRSSAEHPEHPRTSASIQSICEHPEHRLAARVSVNIQSIGEHPENQEHQKSIKSIQVKDYWGFWEGLNP